MRRLLFFILGLMIISGCTIAFGSDKSVGQPYRFIYTITNASGAHVTGQSPTVKIQKLSNNYFYDFNDSTFKASGWTSKTRILTEESTNGYYYYTFTPPASETSSDMYLFIVDNADSTYADHAALLVKYDDIIGTVNRARGR